jgi:hypothetical protein
MRGRILATVVASLVVLPTPLVVHQAECRLPSLGALRERALRTVDVALETWTLRMVTFFLHDEEVSGPDICEFGVL